MAHQRLGHPIRAKMNWLLADKAERPKVTLAARRKRRGLRVCSRRVPVTTAKVAAIVEPKSIVKAEKTAESMNSSPGKVCPTEIATVQQKGTTKAMSIGSFLRRLAS